MTRVYKCNPLQLKASCRSRSVNNSVVTIHLLCIYTFYCRMDSRDDFDGASMTIERAVELLGSPNDKYQTSGANYIQHTCYQDENAKSLVCVVYTFGLFFVKS